MKKWQIIVIVVVVVAVGLVAGGSALYKYYIVPKYLEPVLTKVSESLQQDEIIDELYEEALRLYEEGYIEDDTYSNFIRSYNKHYNTGSEEAARAVLDAKNDEDDYMPESSAVTARYASKKVGIEIVQQTESDNLGKSQMTYSGERTSDRVKAEDLVAAEKLLSKEEQEAEATETPDIVESAYQKLKANMTGDEYGIFVTIMRKLDIGTLQTYINDKEGLKEYLHSNLTDEEYKNIVNLGYKYAYLFIE